MIVSFCCDETEKLFRRVAVAARWREVASVALRKLSYLNGASRVEDLRVPPGNRLEKLKGDRREQYSIRINQRWRVCLEFENGNAYNVEIIDYH